MCTRWWTAATVLTSALVQCHMVTPFQLFYSFRAVFIKSQVGRASMSFTTILCIYQLTMQLAVLATVDDVSLLRSVFARPALSHILPTTLCTAARGVIRQIGRIFFMAASLRHGEPHRAVATGFNAIPRAPSLLYPRLHLVSPQPRHQTKLPGLARLHGSVPAVGADGLQLVYARHDPQRRDHGCRHWPHLVLLQRRIPPAAQWLQAIRPPKLVEEVIRGPQNRRFHHRYRRHGGCSGKRCRCCKRAVINNESESFLFWCPHAGHPARLNYSLANMCK